MAGISYARNKSDIRRGVRASESHSLTPTHRKRAKRYGWYNTLFYCSRVMAIYTVTYPYHIYIFVIENSATDSNNFMTEGIINEYQIVETSKTKCCQLVFHTLQLSGGQIQ